MRVSKKVVLAALIFTSCSSGKLEVPEGILPDSTMRKIIVEMHIADAAASISNTSPVLPQFRPEMFYETTLEKYGTDREQFLASIKFYSQNSKELSRIFEEALEEVSKQQAEENR